MKKKSIKKNNKKNKRTVKTKKGGKASKETEISRDYIPAHQQIETENDKKLILNKINKKDEDIQKLIDKRNSSEKRKDVNIKHKEDIREEFGFKEIKLLIENKFMESDKKNSIELQEIKDRLINIESMLTSLQNNTIVSHS